MANTDTHGVGTAVYYTGDVANQSGRGVVVALRPASPYGAASMDIVLEDGRALNGIHMSNFAGPGRRFWTMAEWEADRAKRIAEMRAEHAALCARRAAVTDQAVGVLQTLPLEALLAAVRGEVDLNAIARAELASRGLDHSGKWVGFERAAALAQARS